jgi:anti-sigma28 factor (negative regulator of flagellin synthesis)
MAMPTESSTPNTDPPNESIANDPRPLATDARTSAATKGAATLRRHKEQRRAERLSEIRAEIADGTLVVRQMTAAQHNAPFQTARQTVARNEARLKLTRAPSERDP